MSHLILFQRILSECTTTNNLRPEYEMWLTQEVFPYKLHCYTIYDFLTTLTSDENGWIHWFLHKTYRLKTDNNNDESDDEKNEHSSKKKGEYRINYDYNYEKNNTTEKAKKHLQLSIKCNHKYAICEEFNIEILEKELENGNGRAAYKLARFHQNYASLFSREREKSLKKSQSYIEKGIMLKDFCCVYDCIEKIKLRNDYDENETELTFIVHDLMLKWGYHSNIKLRMYRESNEDYTFVGENLINLGIPCGYFFNSDYHDGSTMDIIQTLDKGKINGCSKCEEEMLENIVSYDFAAKLIKENEQLKQLQTLSLEDCVKNVISEYI